ncbi:MAG: pyridoxal phosphate-dependent aminotransferase [Oscillibacter sp.]|nr:pyridoxal phosphate-dependent aminotransferase [Oscillibacter sp.]
MTNQFFDTAHFPERRNSNSVKWDGLAARYGREDLLPLWVADMDFPSPPCVREALHRAVDFGVYGYFAPPASYQDAFLAWEWTHHQAAAERAWLRFTPGVVTGIYWSISALTAPGDGVAVLTPCYYPFLDAVRDTGRRLVCSNLLHTEAGYTIDFQDLEEKIRRERVTMLLLCSPHNPVGRVWTEGELTRLLDICARHGVLAVSDEIHQDLVFGGRSNWSCLRFPAHLDRVIVLTSGSKTFNIAGLQNSFAVIPNEALRKAFDAYVKTIRIKKGSALGYVAAEAGYREGGPWLAEVLTYLQENDRILRETLTKALPEIRIEPLEGTYMAWVDLSAYVDPERLVSLVQDRARLAVDFGFWFWPEELVPAGEAHIRINLAASRENVVLAAERLIQAVREQEGAGR